MRSPSRSGSRDPKLNCHLEDSRCWRSPERGQRPAPGTPEVDRAEAHSDQSYTAFPRKPVGNADSQAPAGLPNQKLRGWGATGV